MAASDLVVHSSTEPEPLGRVVMEAIALSTPVIGTAAGGVPEMISPGETGTLVPLGDVGAMADAISRDARGFDSRRYHGPAGAGRLDTEVRDGPLRSGD